MPCKGIHIPEQQTHGEECRNCVSPDGSLSPASVSRQTAELRNRGNMHFHHWQWSSKSSVRWAPAENRIQHPCFSHRNISHFRIGKTNMSSYLGRGLQSLGKGEEATCRTEQDVQLMLQVWTWKGEGERRIISQRTPPQQT